MHGGVVSVSKLLRIGELAKRSGKSVRALHLYEEMALLKPSVRSRGGFRLYEPASVARVEWISKLQEAGFSLNALRDLLRDVEVEGAAPDAMARVRGVFAQKLAETRDARARFEKLERDLLDSLAYLDGCRTCEPVHRLADCNACNHHGHDGREQPILVAGLHNTPSPSPS